MGKVTAENDTRIEEPAAVPHGTTPARTCMSYERTINLGDMNFAKVVISSDWPHLPTEAEFEKAKKFLEAKLTKHMEEETRPFRNKAKQGRPQVGGQ